MKKLLIAATVAALSVGGAAWAATVDLDSLGNCGLGSATNGISTGDVTGNLGGSTDCWGTASGNDSQQTGVATDGSSNFETGGMLYSFVSKKDIGGGITGIDIGLTVTPDATDGTKGSWSVDAAKFAPYGDFLISLKAASNPGYAVWLFSGSDAASTSGTWSIAWDKDLSHLSIYAKKSDTPVVPLPAAGWMLIAGVGGLVAMRRRRKN
jgi:hypothetical protein